MEISSIINVANIETPPWRASGIARKQPQRRAYTAQEIPTAVRTAWARLIQKVEEVDPLICPNYGGEMRFLAVIEESPVIKRILRHIGAWDPSPTAAGAAGGGRLAG